MNHSTGIDLQIMLQKEHRAQLAHYFFRIQRLIAEFPKKG